MEAAVSGRQLLWGARQTAPQLQGTERGRGMRGSNPLAEESLYLDAKNQTFLPLPQTPCFFDKP